MRWLIIAVLLAGLSSTVLAARLSRLAVTQAAETVDVALQFDALPTFTHFRLISPHRFVIDFNRSDYSHQLKKQCVATAMYFGCRFSINKNKRLRLVFDLKPGVAVSVRRTPVARLALHFFQPKKTVSLVHKQLTDLKKTVAKRLPRAKLRSAIVNGRLRDVVVVLDPGHGGKDPGASGPKGTLEKDIVLVIAKRLKNYLDKQPGMSARLTRRSDYYIPLRQRLARARKYKADVFISIHADAFKNRRSHGASVFALSQRGATSEAARWLAEKENYSELSGVNLSGLNDTTGLVRSVLIDLSQTATIGSSLQLGREVLGRLGDLTTLHNENVEQARFVVLKSPDIPSILIETGFISNPREERNLRSTAYQKKLALSILGGLKRYFWQQPPRGTYLAKHRGQYHVVAGDNLLAIAKRFGVSVTALKKRNQLSTNSIRFGQALYIPELT